MRELLVEFSVVVRLLGASVGHAIKQKPINRHTDNQSTTQYISSGVHCNNKPDTTTATTESHAHLSEELLSKDGGQAVQEQALRMHSRCHGSPQYENYRH